MAKTATRQVSIFLNGKEVENTIKAIAAEQRKANNELANMVRGTEEYENKVKELRQINDILREHNEGLRGIKQGWDLTKVGIDKFVGIAAGAFTVDAVVGYGKELFNTAIKMEGLAKKARVVFAETLPNVTKEAEKNATAMGLTTSQYVASAAAIQDILVPMGFQRDRASEISTQLINLSGALSEWTGGQVSASEVSDILSAALTGERERLKQLGIVLQQSDIDARLAEKGQKKLEGAMRQQAEAAATLELVLEKSQDAQTAYAANADSMTRRTAELSARFEQIKERLSTALVPVFEGLVTVLEDAGDAFSAFVSVLDDPEWGDTVKKALAPIFGLGSVDIIQKIFGTKKQLSESQAFVDQLVKETDELLVKYNVKKGGDTVVTTPGLTEEEKKKREAAAKKAREEAERLQKELTDIIERVTTQRRDLIAKAQKDELGIIINGIEDRYKKEIEKATELEKKGVEGATAQRIALEHLKAQEVGKAIVDFTTENVKKAAEAQAKSEQEAYEFLQQRQKERESLQAEVDTFKAEAKAEESQSKQELELQQLEDQYQKLLLLAEDYFNSDLDLKAAYEERKKAITDRYAKEASDKKQKYDDDILKAETTLQESRLDILTTGAALLGGFFEQSSALGKALFLFEKAAAAVSVILNLQKEKAAIFAATRLGTIFDPTGALGAALAAPQIAAANIRAGISLGTIAATAIKQIAAPKTTQKAAGRYLTVTGADDGRQYNASVIGAPATGLLPGYPVLFQSQATGAPVLASERGAEYFVASRDLTNPAVANYVRLIDNIVTGSGRRVRQFADGGENTPAPASAAPASVDLSVIRDLASVVSTLNSLLSRGIVAVIPDGTVVDISKRFKKIETVSGGFFS